MNSAFFQQKGRGILAELKRRFFDIILILQQNYSIIILWKLYFPLRTLNCFWRETSKGIIEKEVLTMSEKAQEVRKRRLESIAYLKDGAEIAFDFILNEFDERTAKEDYSSVSLHLINNGVPTIGYGSDFKMCNDVEIGLKYHSLFLKIIADMFNAEEGYSARVQNGGNPEVIVSIDVV